MNAALLIQHKVLGWDCGCMPLCLLQAHVALIGMAIFGLLGL